MRHLLLNLWKNENDFTQIEESIRLITQAGHKDIHMYILNIGCEEISDIDSSFSEIIKSQPTVHITIIRKNIAEVTSIEDFINNLTAILSEIVLEQDRIYLLHNQNHPRYYHALVHYCSQVFQSQTTFLSNQKKLSLSIEAYVSDRDEYHKMYDLVMSGNYRAAKILVNNQQNYALNTLLDLGNSLLTLQIHNTTRGENPFDVLASVLEDEKLCDKEEQLFLEILKGVQQGEQEAFIYYLYEYASFLYKEEDLVDFIVLYYRLVEELLLYALGWNADDRNRFFIRKNAAFSLPFPRWQLTKHFHRYLKALSQYVRGLETNIGVKIRRDKCVGLEKLTKQEKYFVEIYLLLKDKKLEEFLDLRHEGISGHGFADFSKEDFIKTCGGIPPLEKIDTILEKMNLVPPYSIFELVNRGILALAGKENTLKINLNKELL
ncbi:hypothetical protein EJF36_06585 [Bacillus sp. HMF5848]|uniref:hypothetical protein n=1 Tax=Bacillus sp. HMF5848 TaxID=2495421 RepID=UPI000F7968B2|nr:hypothetical protein [Bacillus sp. HMF5848]RSK26552.1 hypothetical protein EJF36_06585 [Bacillus sp. HMF5848]